MKRTRQFLGVTISCGGHFQFENGQDHRTNKYNHRQGHDACLCNPANHLRRYPKGRRRIIASVTLLCFLLSLNVLDMPYSFGYGAVDAFLCPVTTMTSIPPSRLLTLLVVFRINTRILVSFTQLKRRRCWLFLGRWGRGRWRQRNRTNLFKTDHGYLTLYRASRSALGELSRLYACFYVLLNLNTHIHIIKNFWYWYILIATLHLMWHMILHAYKQQFTFAFLKN